MLRNHQFAPGEMYHAYNRGTDKRVLFKSKIDYERFQKLLYACNTTTPIVFKEVPQSEHFRFTREDTLVDIGAYCLMPNHFHILLHEKNESGVTSFMKKLGTAYSMYFNKKYERTGSLFEGRFKTQHVDDDNYLRYLYAYIHLNPIKLIDSKWKEKEIDNLVNAKKYLDTYPYSSYSEYMDANKRDEQSILNKEPFPDYFNATTFEESIDFWITYTPE